MSYCWFSDNYNFSFYFFHQNTGNLCQWGFDHPLAFSKMLGIPVFYVQHMAAILKVLSSKKAIIDPDLFEDFCNGHLDEKFKNSKTKWNHHNPTVFIIIMIIFPMIKTSYINFKLGFTLRETKKFRTN